MKRTVFILLPAFNEQEAIGPLICAIRHALQNEIEEYEIIVVDDGSSDNTAGEVREAMNLGRLTLIQHDVNKGLSVTIRTGILAALEKGRDEDVIVTMDADLTHLPGLLPRMMRLIDEGNELVIASRYTILSRTRCVPLYRRIISNIGNFIFRLLFPIEGVKDYTCGYRAYRASLLRKAIVRYDDAFISQPGFVCMADILLKLKYLNPIAAEAPMILRYDLKPGASKMAVGKTLRQTMSLVVKRRLGIWD